LLLTFAFTAIVILATSRKDALLRDYERAREERIANANKVAALATERVAVAEKHAAEANKTAEGFRLSIAEANERAATANEVAERERLARLQLEARLAPRSLPLQQQAAIAATLKPLGPFSIEIFTYSDVTEVNAIANAIGGSLVAAGWDVALAHAQGRVTVTGIVLALPRAATEPVRKAAQTLAAELTRHNVGINLIDRPLEEIPRPGMSFGRENENAQMRMLIGTK